MSNTDLNAELVEAFGNLERLCNQIYNAQHGVTRYIEDMERTYGGSSRVANWDQDLRQLKDIRHKRNNLSHGEVLFTSPCATEETIDFVVDFRDRILNGTDPLSENRKIIAARSTQKLRATQNKMQLAYTYRPSSDTTLPSYTTPPKCPRQSVICRVCLALIIVTVAVLVWFLFQI